MATTITVGQTLPLTIAFLDQAGQPMTATPDQPPGWATNSTTDLLSVAADGLSATLKGVNPGDDVITLTVIVAGVTFSASLDVTVVAAPQVLTSVEIVPGTPV